MESEGNIQLICFLNCEQFHKMAIPSRDERRFCLTFSMAGKREWEQKKACGREEKTRIMGHDHSSALCGTLTRFYKGPH